MSRRCRCGGGECWPCWKQAIMADWKKTHKRTYCNCRLKVCAVCELYKKLEKKSRAGTKKNGKVRKSKE
jgi:hypothetical protein